MKIAQITPGVISIPPNGWGAVEKIIWEYTKVLRKLGHVTDIRYTDDIKSATEYDVVHVHMANLALLLKERGIPYVFSHHDHHAYYFGKNSDVYKQNLEAIKGSVVSFVHARYLLDYFDNQPQLKYLSHGANIEDYYFDDKSKDLLGNECSLVMMANNGLLGDSSVDRKGFLPGIESARKLGLPITIIGPSKNNKDFFEFHNNIQYDKLTILYDLDYQEAINEIRKHHIFLNLGDLEAGHPNLTVTESISMGIPVVGFMESNLLGMERLDPKNISIDIICNAIKKVKLSYSEYVLECNKQRDLISWNVIVSQMLMDYVKFNKIQQKDLLINSYNSTNISNTILRNNREYSYHFKDNPHFHNYTSDRYHRTLLIRDKRTNRIIYYNILDNNSWYTIPDNKQKYVDYEIVLKQGAKIIDRIELDIGGKHILIEKGAGDIIDAKYLNKFIEEHEIIPTLTSELSSILSQNKEFDHYIKNPDKNNDDFYRILNTDQIKDYYNKSDKIEDHTLIILNSHALGDTIAFVPYANEYAKKHNIKCSISTSFNSLFLGKYNNLNFIDYIERIESYSDVLSTDYIYEMPLQLGFAEQLKLSEYGKIRPVINGTNKGRPINKKYVCFSMHSTTQAKNWNNNNGWEKLCDMLKKSGYIPVCIDRHYSFGVNTCWNEIPNNCLNKTGMDLYDMINYIEHCEFFIGLSSGLTWVAHGLNKKCVLISGVTSKDNEFDDDCIRIHRDDICNSCFGQTNKYVFDPGDWFWCPLHKNTGKMFECTKKISAKQVIDKIIEREWI